MRISRRSRRWWLGGLASLGVVVAHTAAYRFAEPHAHARNDLLRHTGHGEWWILIALAVGAFVVACAGPLLRRRTGDSLVTSTFARLALLQVSGFVLMEALERLVHDTSLSGLLGEPAVALGILLQIVAALAGAVLLRVAASIVAAIRRRRFGCGTSTTPLFAPAHEAPVRSPIVGDPRVPRAPPVASLS